MFVFSFAGLILIGALLFTLPVSSSGAPLRFIDALFTSTSGVCVTGLTVVDAGADLSLFGQIVLLLLFQVGGLGIITFSVFFFAMMGRGLSFKEREIIQSTFMNTPRRDFLFLLRWILVIVFSFEGIGTALLFMRFSQEFPFVKALYYSVFHSVSAFNNCGFSLFSNSLVAYHTDWIVNLTIVILMIIGGIGFIVQFELISWFSGRQRRLSLHVKIVLIVTAVLLVAGSILFYLFEMNNTLKGASVSKSVLASLFQAATPRTCGFNTIHIASLTNPTLLLMMVLMFIGASPGSTGGGIKNTSFAIMMLIIWNKLKKQEDVSVFHRTVPKEILTRTVAIIIASTFSIFIVVSVLLVADYHPGSAPELNRLHFIEYLFESISAFGTVGLSMGVTNALNWTQKLAIIILMFAGRVGPLTLAYTWFSRRKESLVYAEESIMVG